MAAGADELLDFLLSGIAICGVQGASSADFYRIVHEYYYKQNHHSFSGRGSSSTDPSSTFGRNFYERVWQWVVHHPDVRIYYKREARSLTLPEFEALENQEANTPDASQAAASGQRNPGSVSKYTATTDNGSMQPPKPLASLGNSMRQRLLAEGNRVKNAPIAQSDPLSSTHGGNVVSALSPRVREARKIPGGSQHVASAFEEPDISIQPPRLFASQNRTWIAIAGHPIDLKKVAGSEFILLTIIARAGPDGIAQPKLQRLSGQDKRSVPQRTNSLQEKGYIDKRPVQDGRARTSLCTHRMFLKDRSEEPQSVNEVFGLQTLHLTGMLFLLNKVLEATPVVQVRHLRTKMGVSVERWNGRAVRGALIRLEQSGYLERFTVEKKYKDPRLKTNLLTCIKRLREPEADDVNNLRFKRMAFGFSAADPVEEEPLEDDNAGEGLMRDLELDMMGEVSDGDDEFDADGRIPPQWTPDRLLTNLVVDAIDVAGTDGIDTAKLRDLTTGFFWKRPLESLVTRLTEDWHLYHPLHTRHLAIVRDTTMTSDIRRVHYAYRTYRNFQKAVDAGELTWEALQLEKGKKSKHVPSPATAVDSLGFHTLNPNDFYKRTGLSSLPEVCAAIVSKQRHSRHWESVLLNGGTDRQASATPERGTPNGPKNFKSHSVSQGGIKRDAKVVRPLLTQAERIALGLPAKGRLGVDYESQIRAHRKKTGDPNSIPENLVKGVHADQLEATSKPKYDRRPGPPLLTREERKARGLPEQGRLSFEVTKQILKEQNRKEPLTHMNSSVDFVDGEHVLAYEPSSDGNHVQHEEEHGSAIEVRSSIVEGSENRISTNGDIEMVLDVVGSQASVPADTTSPAEIPFTNPKPFNDDTSDQVPQKMRAYRKRSFAEAEIEAKQPKKRAKKSSDDSPEEGPHSNLDFTTQKDGGVEGGVLNTGMHLGIESGDGTLEKSAPTRVKEAGLSGEPSLSVSADNEVDASAAEPPTAPQPVKTLKGGRGSQKKMAKQKLHTPLTEAELHAQAYKAQYDERSEPGLYFDLKATRPGKGGRGRPRKMFLATFKLPGLHNLDWFDPYSTETPNENLLSTLPTTPATVLSGEQPHHVETETTRPRVPSVSNTVPGTIFTASMRASDDVSNQQHSTMTPQSRSTTSEISTQSSTSGPMGTVNSRIGTKTNQSTSVLSSAPNETGEPMEVGESLGTPDLGKSLRQPTTVPEVRTTVEQEVTPAVEPDHMSHRPLPAMSRLPPALDTVTPLGTTPYQSPYDPPRSPTPPRSEMPSSAHEVTPVINDISQTNRTLDTTFVVSEEAPAVVDYAHNDQKKRDHSMWIGGGNALYWRKKLVIHILELCDGILPGMDIMYNVWPAVWNELAPKNMLCSHEGTVRDHIYALYPSQLSKGTFKIPRSDIPGKKTKIIWFRNHFRFNSPEVQDVISKIIQALPGKYCPPRLQKYWRKEDKPLTVLPKIDNSYLVELNPPTSQKLKERIYQARQERRMAIQAAREDQRRAEAEARKEAKRLANEQKRQKTGELSDTRQKLFKKRQRLAGLNDGPQLGTGNLATRPTMGLFKRLAAPTAALPSLPSQQPREGSPASVSSEEEPLINMRPSAQTTTMDGPNVTMYSRDDQPALQPSAQLKPSDHVEALLAPATRLHLPTHTFSTDFILKTIMNEPNKNCKRSRIEQSTDQVSRKRPRISHVNKPSHSVEAEDDFLARHHIEIRESSDEQDEEEHNEESDPTIAQRLAGLTGDLNQPDFEPGKRRRQPTWSEPRRRRDRKRRSYNAMKEAKGRTYPETFDPLGEFRKLCYTLVIASSMVGEDGVVEWNIVSTVYKEASRFDLEKTKKMWAWMRRRMPEQLHGMTSSFQSQFLRAYEEGKIEPIENPDTYDWAKLVRWALLTCTYLEPPLPVAREALNDCHLDFSSYDVLDRKVWYNTPLANINRDERLAKCSFGSPLHGKRKPTMPGNEQDLKARSLVRSTISTPKELYDKNVAHGKLKDVPEHVINRTVNDFLRAGLIKERKVKRQVPGRNYLFAPQFAKRYRCTFELSDFMTAVKLKKDLDAAFANTDPDKRTYSVSRMAENGTVMALISMASEGKIKLVPKLPPVRNEFNASLPRISVWGYSEGDYAHRKMDRKRLFWPIEVVPTDTYEYGNPLQPASSPLPSGEDGTPRGWDSMPEPPLPGRQQDPSPLLPIWSTIDGQTIIYPWWNRILNIAIQALLFSPSITAQDIFTRCETYTTEIFEIQLVLDWLVEVKAAKRSPHGTYEVLPGYWAVFGDKLIGEDTDEFGDHVRRQKKNLMVGDTWRTGYNREYNLRTTSGAQADKSQEESASQQVFNNVRKQYTIAKHVATEAVERGDMEGVQQDAAVSEVRDQGQVQDETQTSTPASIPAVVPIVQEVLSTASTPAFTPAATPSTTTQDVEITDPDADAAGEDLDAEGEPDDEYL